MEDKRDLEDLIERQAVKSRSARLSADVYDQSEVIAEKDSYI
jgi:hypothetical protein